MNDILRKGFLLGIGAAVSGKERLEKMLNDLVEKNELTQEQAKTVMKSYIEKGETKTEEWTSKQETKIRSLAEDMGLATKKDIDELHAKIRELEDKWNHQ
ncbi:MAG TPA: hypothetical protein VK136_04250 [Bacillota bacterium]|nr:hypothetical protein [Bacillota bacterium]